MPSKSPEGSGIGTLNEGSLHAALKELLAEPGDELEVPLDRFVIDIRRGDLLIEVQTQSFAAMARKLDSLLDSYTIRIVYPVAVTTFLHRPDAKPRRSPKKGDRYSVLDELVSIPTLIDHPRLGIDVALLQVERHQVHDPTARRGRGGWRTTDKRLRSLEGWYYLRHGSDLLDMLPSGLPEVFTTADIASSSPMSRSSAQKLAYILRALSLIQLIDRDKRGHLYQLNHPARTNQRD